jgi:hypothetical protein
VAVANARSIVLGLGFISIQLAPLATLRAFWVREFCRRHRTRDERAIRLAPRESIGLI